MDVLCVEFRGSDDPVDSLFLLDHDWVDIERGAMTGGEAGRITVKPAEADESKFFFTWRPGVDFTTHSIWLNNCRSISPAIKTPNFKLKLAHFSSNLFTVCQTLRQKKPLILFVRKSHACMLMKSTPCMPFISHPLLFTDTGQPKR
jgi:hypothetical protein